MRTCAAALLLVLVALTLGGCFGQHCVRVVNGWTFPEFASDGTLPATSLVKLRLAADPRGRHIRSFATSYAFGLILRHEHGREDAAA